MRPLHIDLLVIIIDPNKPGVQCSQYCARPAKAADCGFSQPCATQDHEWKKAGAGSFAGDIDLLVIIIDANSNKTKLEAAA